MKECVREKKRLNERDDGVIEMKTIWMEKHTHWLIHYVCTLSQHLIHILNVNSEHTNPLYSIYLIIVHVSVFICIRYIVLLSPALNASSFFSLFFLFLFHFSEDGKKTLRQNNLSWLKGIMYWKCSSAVKFFSKINEEFCTKLLNILRQFSSFNPIEIFFTRVHM